MTNYKCRTTKPSVSQWFDVVAKSPELAVRDFHYDKLGLIPGVRFKPDETQKQTVVFACIEVDGHGEWFSRVWEKRITRRGGVKRRGKPISIDDVAKTIDWDGDPQELLAPGWEGEEDTWQ